MTRRQLSRRWVAALTALAGVAVVICVLATVEAGPVAPVFFWRPSDGADVVLTKQQYESALTAQQVGRLAAAAAVVLALAVIALTFRARKAPRARWTSGYRDDLPAGETATSLSISQRPSPAAHGAQMSSCRV